MKDKQIDLEVTLKEWEWEEIEEALLAYRWEEVEGQPGYLKKKPLYSTYERLHNSIFDQRCRQKKIKTLS